MLVTRLSGTKVSLEISIAVLAIVHGRKSSSLPNAFVWGSLLRGWILIVPMFTNGILNLPDLIYNTKRDSLDRDPVPMKPKAPSLLGV